MENLVRNQFEPDILDPTEQYRHNKRPDPKFSDDGKGTLIISESIATVVQSLP